MAAKADGAVADMTAAGAFGPDIRLVSFALEGLHTELDQFASCVLYGAATVDDGHGRRRRSHRLVFKFKHPTPEMRDFYNNDSQFHNETLFYERIAPFLLAGHGNAAPPTLCRYFYGRNDCGERAHRDVVVMENETVRGYRKAVTGHRLSLDLDHLIVALGTLAKFHGLSYRAKHEDSVKFKETIADVKETQWSENGEWVFHHSTLHGLISVALDRLMERQVTGGGAGDGGCGDNIVEWISRFQSELLTDVVQSLRRMVVPVEPLAVLCHGDFNRNNLLFRYDDSGRPVDALAYDMATVRYGSPVLDLSFFLFMNADRRTRDDHWDALLDAYCETLAVVAGDVPVPGRDQVDAEMREHGFYGLAHVSYFARVMLEDTTQVDTADFFAADDLQLFHLLLSNGGDTATDWVADVVEHLLRCKYAGTPVPSTAANEVSKPVEI